MKRFIQIVLILFVVITVPRCHDGVPHYADNPEGNFEALWNILDRNYCFFSYKKIDWDSVYTAYYPRVSATMSSDELFALMGEMLSELKDGHVNLVAPHDMTRYWKWHEDFPANFDWNIVKKYLGTDYAIAGGMRYKILNDNVGYIYYGSFSNNVEQANLDEIIRRMEKCHGIILDVRNNGGGNLTNADRIASRFFTERTLIGYILHKTGKGHDDFSLPYPRYIKSSGRRIFNKKVVVLTNRGCYSATNEFVNIMKYAPQATIIGDKTGGGSGLPFSSELPNGWRVRFSASPMLNAQKEHIEFGIEPDIYVHLTDSDARQNRDSLIEKARELIHQAAK